MSTRGYVLLAVALTAGVLVWYFWDTLKAIFAGGDVIEDTAAEDEIAKDIPLTKSETQRMAQLLPHVNRALQSTINDLAGQGIRVLVGQTSRTQAQEQANITKGVSATTKSWHLLNRAADVYPIDPATGDPDMNGHNVELFRTMHTIAAKYGFTNIAFNSNGSKRMITTSKGKIWDGGHMQFTDGMTWDEASKESVS